MKSLSENLFLLLKNGVLFMDIWILVVGTAAAIFSGLALWFIRKRDFERKKSWVRGLQPKLKIGAALNHDTPEKNYWLNVGFVNLGKSSALDVIVSIDGLEKKEYLDEVKPAISFRGTYEPTGIEIALSPSDKIISTRLNNPALRVTFHDKWNPEIEYPVVSLPFIQKEEPENKLLNFGLDFSQTSQSPSPEKSYYDKYTKREIKDIFRREFL